MRRGRSISTISISSTVSRPNMIRCARIRVPTRTGPEVRSSTLLTEPIIVGHSTISISVAKAVGGRTVTAFVTLICIGPSSVQFERTYCAHVPWLQIDSYQAIAADGAHPFDNVELNSNRCGEPMEQHRLT